MRTAAILLAVMTGAILAQDRPPAAPAKPSLEMREARHRLGLAATRAIAYFRHMDSIAANLDDQGIELHPDLVILRSRIESELDATDEALDQNDPKKANQALDRAEALLGRLAQRLGG